MSTKQNIPADMSQIPHRLLRRSALGQLMQRVAQEPALQKRGLRATFDPAKPKTASAPSSI